MDTCKKVDGTKIGICGFHYGDKANDMSIKLAEKLGFVFTGQMKNKIFRGKEYPHKILLLDYTAV